jgi:hypothetical protein
MSVLLSISIGSYCSIDRLALIYFPYAQQDHKLNGIGISELMKNQSSNKIFLAVMISKLLIVNPLFCRYKYRFKKMLNRLSVVFLMIMFCLLIESIAEKRLILVNTSNTS